jgi:hypothetical protein
MRFVGNSHQLEKLPRRLNIRLLGKKVKFSAEDTTHHHIFQSSHLGKWPRGLEGPTYSPSPDLVCPARGNLLVLKQDSATGGSVATRDQIEQCRFPCTIGTHQPHYLTFVDTEVYLFQGPKIPESFTQCFQL